MFSLVLHLVFLDLRFTFLCVHWDLYWAQKARPDSEHTIFLHAPKLSLCLQAHKKKKYSPSQDIIFIPSMLLTNIRLVKSCYHTSQWIETKASLYMILSWVDWRNALGSVWLHSLLLGKSNLGQNRKAPSANFMINRFQEQAILQSTLRQQYIKLCIKTMGSFKIKSKCQA